MPGVKKEDVAIDIDGDIVRVSVSSGAEKEEEDKDEAGNVTWHRVERSSAFASRALRLPPSADLGAMTAKLADGVLDVTIPKKKEQGESKKRIAVE